MMMEVYQWKKYASLSVTYTVCKYLWAADQLLDLCFCVFWPVCVSRWCQATGCSSQMFKSNSSLQRHFSCSRPCRWSTHCRCHLPCWVSSAICCGICVLINSFPRLPGRLGTRIFPPHSVPLWPLQHLFLGAFRTWNFRPLRVNVWQCHSVC